MKDAKSRSRFVPAARDSTATSIPRRREKFRSEPQNDPWAAPDDTFGSAFHRGGFGGAVFQNQGNLLFVNVHSTRLEAESFEKTGHIPAHFLAKNAPRGRDTDRASSDGGEQ